MEEHNWSCVSGSISGESVVNQSTNLLSILAGKDVKDVGQKVLLIPSQFMGHPSAGKIQRGVWRRSE